jgi:hypothetical protein
MTETTCKDGAPRSCKERHSVASFLTMAVQPKEEARMERVQS